MYKKPNKYILIVIEKLADFQLALQSVEKMVGVYTYTVLAIGVSVIFGTSDSVETGRLLVQICYNNSMGIRYAEEALLSCQLESLQSLMHYPVHF